MVWPREYLQFAEMNVFLQEDCFNIYIGIVSVLQGASML